MAKNSTNKKEQLHLWWKNSIILRKPKFASYSHNSICDQVQQRQLIAISTSLFSFLETDVSETWQCAWFTSFSTFQSSGQGLICAHFVVRYVGAGSSNTGVICLGCEPSPCPSSSQGPGCLLLCHLCRGPRQQLHVKDVREQKHEASGPHRRSATPYMGNKLESYRRRQRERIMSKLPSLAFLSQLHLVSNLFIR